LLEKAGDGQGPAGDGKHQQQDGDAVGDEVALLPEMG